jgi:hypothetical protein
MPGMSGLLARVVEQLSKFVILMTGSEEIRSRRKCGQLGAQGCFYQLWNTVQDVLLMDDDRVTPGSGLPEWRKVRFL